jgi:serine protein kinase
MLSVLQRVRERTVVSKEELTIEEYLHLCKEDPFAYADPYQRMLTAIGEPKIVDTSLDARLGRIFQNRKLKTWKAFEDFYGLESTIEQIHTYFTAAAQGLEEAHQILYFLGPVGGGKSSLAERLKDLMEGQPIYVLKCGDRESPVQESPLWLFDYHKDAEEIETTFGIARRYLRCPPSPWAIKRLIEANGDITTFRVIKTYPSRLLQRSIAKTEPADESTQDVSSLVGKVDVRKLGDFSQDDPDAYSFSGGLCKANNGILDFVEMFKAPIKVLNPLLTATQEGNYNTTEGLSALPWSGIICAHSNESEWDQFRNNRTNEAFLDRVSLVRVPYCLQKDEEIDIYRKMLRESQLRNAPCAAETLEMLATWSVLTRLLFPENSTLASKLKVYNGELIRDTDPAAKSLIEYKAAAGINEGMTGMSTRFAFKVLSRTFNQDPEEVAANPVHLMHNLTIAVERERLPEETEKSYKNFIKEHLQSEYIKKLEKMLQSAYLESYGDYGQNMFERYFMYADAWIQNTDYRDPDTHEIWDREQLSQECEKIEKPAGIANPKDFRNEIVQYVLRYRASHSGKSPNWTAYEKIKEVIESKIFSSTEQILPVIAFGAKATEEDQEKHEGFVKRMEALGFTRRQVRILVKPNLTLLPETVVEKLLEFRGSLNEVILSQAA